MTVSSQRFQSPTIPGRFIAQKTGEGTSTVNGGIEDKIIDGSFKKTIKTIPLGGQIGMDDKRYEGNITISLDIYIDVNGNGNMNDSGVDISDGITYREIDINKESVVSVDYSTLHVSGM